MTDISKEQVRDLAILARVGLSEAEEESLAKEMTAILDYVSELDQIDTKNVSPTSQVTGLTNVIVKDEVARYKLTRDELLANAPEQEKGFIKVKKVLD